MAHLALSFLGPFQVMLDGQPITGFETAKVRALLAYLAVERERAHFRQALAGLLWPDWPERAAFVNLRGALANLRAAVGDRQAETPFLLVTRETVRFNPASDYALDVAEFERTLREAQGREAGAEAGAQRLAAGVGLYRGPFLEGLSLGDSPSFEEWATLQRECLEQQMLGALERLAAHGMQRGAYEQARAYAQRAVGMDPTREEAQRQLMRALALQGERSAALAQYEACRRTLLRELGVEPARETVALYEAIRAGTFPAAGAIPAQPLPVGSRTLTECGDSLPQRPSQPAEPPERERPLREAPLVVARERELARLGQHLDQALGGEGRVAFVIGEPGSGKTTLVHEFARRAMETHAYLIAASGNCNAYTGIGDPYLPFVEVLRALSGDSAASGARGALTREHARRLEGLFPATLGALLEAGPALVDVMIPGAALLAHAGEMRVDGPLWRERVEELLRRRGAGAQQQADLFAQYTRVLQALAREHPLLLLLDDLQWADAGSLSLLFHLGRRLAGSRILVVGAYRTEEVALGRDGQAHPLEPVVHEFQRTWGDIRIDLAEAEGRRLVEEIIASQPNRLDAAFCEALYQHTGGQALFTVELLRGLQARGDPSGPNSGRGLVRDAEGRWVEGPALDWGTLPTQVESVIAQQIGRLSAEWVELLTVASVEGEAFTAEVVARAGGLDERKVTHALNGLLSKQHHLVDAQSTQRLGAQRLSRYRFRHHLFQQYLYQSLNPVERERRHEEVGNALEALYGAVPEFLYEGWAVAGDCLGALYGSRAAEVASILPQLAWHYRAAGLIEKAVAYLSQAAYRATRSFAPKEAIAHASEGVGLLQPLPFTPERAREEMAFQATLAEMVAFGVSGVFPAVRQANARLCELAQKTGDDVSLTWGLYGLSHFHWARGEYRTAIDLGEQMLALVQRAAPELLPDAYNYLGTLWAHAGRITQAREHLDPLFSATPTPGLLQSWPQRNAVMAGMPSFVYWLAGYPDLALRIAEMVRSLASTNRDALGGMPLVFVRHLRREVQAVQERAQAMLPGTTEERAGSQRAVALYWEGWAIAHRGRAEEGIASMRKALDIWERRGSVLNRPFWLAGLAEGYALAGQPEEGLKAIADALGLVESMGERWCEAELYRLRGELLLQDEDARTLRGLSPRCSRNDQGEASPPAQPEGTPVPEGTLGGEGSREAAVEECFLKAIEVARGQEARSWELRATVSLARLWQRRGKREEARTMLAAIYGWFTEGFDTPDLVEARGLLEEAGQEAGIRNPGLQGKETG